MVITTSSGLNIRAKLGLPVLNQISGWVVLGVFESLFFVVGVNVVHRTVSASLFPFIARIKHASPYSRILSFFLGFGPCFIILSISVEGLFI